MKEISGYEGLYSVSEDGRVFTHRFNKIKELKPGLRGKKSNPYKFVILTKDGIARHHSVHRLVAEAYLENPEKHPQVNHKDFNPFNNHKDNLEWVTNRENAFYSFGKKYTFISPEGVVVEVNDLPSFCKKFKLNRPHMVSVHNGKRVHHQQWRKPKK